MKKLAILLLSGVLCLSMISCTAPADEPATLEETPAATDEAVADDTADAADAEGGDVAGEVAAYVAENQAMFDEQAAAASNDLLTMSVFARDTTIVFSYAYLQDLGVANEEVKVQLDAALPELESAMVASYTALAAEAPVTALVVEYLDMNGAVIASYEFN